VTAVGILSELVKKHLEEFSFHILEVLWKFLNPLSLFVENKSVSGCVFLPIVDRHHLSKHVPVATNTYVTIVELLDVLFYMQFVLSQRKKRDQFFPELLV
jgi:hypothetical protein